MTRELLHISLQNTTRSSTLYAHITGRAVDRNDALVMIQADGTTPYYPKSPDTILSPLGMDCAIWLGPPGTSRTVTIPRIAGGRIWMCTDGPLHFMLNPGPAMVEPSATNPSDPNYNLDWGFCEFTFNLEQLYVNVSYVDFVSIPIALTLETDSGTRSTVPGFQPNALDLICNKLREQDSRDGAGWSKLIVRTSNGKANLRALSPNSGIVMQPTLFETYYDPYTAAVRAKYTAQDLTVNTQAWGIEFGRVMADGKLSFPKIGTFGWPKARDIFSCSTGPFGGYPDDKNKDVMANIGARIAAAFNRSTLLINNNQPEGEKEATYYRETITNHYSRICHEVSPDGRGYAFPYDDVGPRDGRDLSGSLFDPNPQLLIVSIGGGLVPIVADGEL
jgi:hypothetical protein